MIIPSPILIRLALAPLVLGASAHAADSFLHTDWQIVENTTNPFGHPMKLGYQGAPPPDDSSTYLGSPCNSASSARSDLVAATTWSGSGISHFLWANRRNALGAPNTRSNVVSPMIRRAQPLDWQTNTEYRVGELVYIPYASGTNWWHCDTAHTSGSSFSDTNWTEVQQSCINNGFVVPPQCRLEYSSFANAVASNLVQVRWLAGLPDYTDDGTGYMDAATSNGASLSTVYDYDYLQANADVIFTDRPIDMASGGAIGYAVDTDVVYVTPYRMTDWWTDYAPGTNWVTGQLVRDERNLLPNNFAAYDKSFYTDSATGLTPSDTSKTITDDYCVLSGINQAIRHKYLLPADSGATYELEVTGIIDAAANEQLARIRLQVFGLDSNGDKTASHVEANFNNFNHLGRQFTLRQKFSAVGDGSDILAWPAGAIHLRFSVNANSGLTGSPSVRIASMRVVQKDLQADDFVTFDKTYYTDSATGLNPPDTSKLIEDGYCKLTGINKAVRHKYLLPASHGAIYELTISGIVDVPTETQNGKLRLQVFGLDDNGNETATHVETTFNDLPAPGTPFIYSQKFAAIGNSADIKAWPAGATLLRFSANTNGGLSGDEASIWLSSARVSVAESPTYWRALQGHTSGTSSGATFATFAADRMDNPTVFKRQKLGVVLDYEVSDGRPDSGVPSAFSDLYRGLHERGYEFSVYTNNLDDASEDFGVISTATNNGFSESNLDDVIGTVDSITAVISGKNYYGNDCLGLMAANYNRLRFVNGTYNGTERSNFRPGKIGFTLELPDRGARTSAAITSMSAPDANGRITITTTPGNGATKNMYVNINGLNGVLGGHFNGNVYRVYSGGTTFVIDAMVTSVSPTTGALTLTSLPSFTSYTGGGVVSTEGLSPDDFEDARNTYFIGADVTHFELWRNTAVQSPAAPPTPVNVTGITVTGSEVVVDTDGSVADYRGHRVYLDNLPAPFAELNGCSFTVDAGQVTSCPAGSGSGYSGTHFLLVGYNGSGLSTDTSISSGTASEALSRNVNQKISKLAGLP